MGPMSGHLDLLRRVDPFLADLYQRELSKMDEVDVNIVLSSLRARPSFTSGTPEDAVEFLKAVQEGIQEELVALKESTGVEIE